MIKNITIIHIATHPARARILGLLGERPEYAAKMARELEIDPRVVRFHISVLERHKLIKGEFELTKSSEGNPYAAKYWSLTESGEEVLSQIRRLRLP